MTRTDLPSIKRVCLAMALGPLVASALYSVHAFGLDGRFFWGFMIILTVGAYPLTLFLAIPIYVVVRDYGRLSPAFVCVTAGFIAVVPWLLLELWPSSGSLSAKVDNVWLVQDGVLTLAGWIRKIRSYAATFLAGALGGAVFWLIAIRPLAKRTQHQISAAHPPVPDGDRAV